MTSSSTALSGALKLELLASQAAIEPAYIHQGISQSVAAEAEEEEETEEGGGEEGYVSDQQEHSPSWQLLGLSDSLQEPSQSLDTAGKQG